MKKIDVKTWKRRVPYENFIKYTNPIFSLATRLDVTELYARCKKENTSFFTDFLYMVTTVLNGIEEFRLRLRGGDVVLYDVIHPSYIVLSDEGVIETCRTELKGGYARFYEQTRKDAEDIKRGRAKKNIFNVDGDNNWFFISCMPWTDLTSISNPYDLSDADTSSIPRLAWGKFVDENGRKKMTMDIAVHHALLDGEPVCRAFNLIQRALDEPYAFFEGR